MDDVLIIFEITRLLIHKLDQKEKRCFSHDLMRTTRLFSQDNEIIHHYRI